MRVDHLAVMLSNSPQRRTAGGMREEKEQKGRRMMRVKESCFHTRGEQAGGLRECVCVQSYTSMVLYLGLKSQRRCLK